MSDGKSAPCLSGSTILQTGKPGPVAVHPRFASRIQAVLLEKEETAQQLLTNTYCLLKKVATQLHAHEEAFGAAQYRIIVDKCAALCRISRGAATKDRPQLSQVLSLRDEISDLRKAIAAAAPGTCQDASTPPDRHFTLPDDIARGAGETRNIHGEPSGEPEQLPGKKLTARNGRAPKLAARTAFDQRSLGGHSSA